MPHYLLYHRHGSSDCAASFAAWNGFASELRAVGPMASCAYGAHEIWWWVESPDTRAALDLLPDFVSTRTLAIRVAPVTVP